MARQKIAKISNPDCFFFQTQGRDPQVSSCFSSSTGTVGVVSGRNSPSGGFNSSQDCKDDDITTDGIFHTNSPSTKRRKRTSEAPSASQGDNSTSQTAGETLSLSHNPRVMNNYNENKGFSLFLLLPSCNLSYANSTTYLISTKHNMCLYIHNF